MIEKLFSRPKINILIGALLFIISVALLFVTLFFDVYTFSNKGEFIGTIFDYSLIMIIGLVILILGIYYYYKK
jgi:hypothetical protein